MTADAATATSPETSFRRITRQASGKSLATSAGDTTRRTGRATTLDIEGLVTWGG